MVAREIAFGLLDLRLDRATVERDQDVALLEPSRAIGKLYLPVISLSIRGLDRDTRDRRHGAERLESEPDVFFLTAVATSTATATRTLAWRLRDRAAGNSAARRPKRPPRRLP